MTDTPTLCDGEPGKPGKVLIQTGFIQHDYKSCSGCPACRVRCGGEPGAPASWTDPGGYGPQTVGMEPQAGRVHTCPGCRDCWKCERCAGSGDSPYTESGDQKCGRCGGSGVQPRTEYLGGVPCLWCEGHGHRADPNGRLIGPCPRCGGSGIAPPAPAAAGPWTVWVKHDAQGTHIHSAPQPGPGWERVEVRPVAPEAAGESERLPDDCAFGLCHPDCDHVPGEEER